MFNSYGSGLDLLIEMIKINVAAAKYGRGRTKAAEGTINRVSILRRVLPLCTVRRGAVPYSSYD